MIYPNYIIATGTNDYTGSYLYSAQPFLKEGMSFIVKFENTNTKPCTLNVNRFGAVPIRKSVVRPLDPFDIATGGVYTFVYDGTSFQATGAIGLSSSYYFVYYFQNALSDVATYYKQLSATYSPSTALAARTINTNPKLVYNFITDPGIPGISYFPPGLYQVNVHAYQSAGTKTSYLYVEIWETDSLGVDIAKICTTGNSIPLTGVVADLFVTFQLPSNYIMASTTSRICTRIYAVPVGGGSNPQVIMYVGGATDSRTFLLI